MSTMSNHVHVSPVTPTPVVHDDDLTPLYRALWRIAARKSREESTQQRAQAEDIAA